MSENLTVEILKDIRDEIRSTNTRLDTTNTRLEVLRVDLTERLDATNSRLDATNSRLDSVESALKDLAAQMLFLSKFVKNSVEKQGEELTDIRSRLSRVEGRVYTDER